MCSFLKERKLTKELDGLLFMKKEHKEKLKKLKEEPKSLRLDQLAFIHNSVFHFWIYRKKLIDAIARKGI